MSKLERLTAAASVDIPTALLPGAGATFELSLLRKHEVASTGKLVPAPLSKSYELVNGKLVPQSNGTV